MKALEKIRNFHMQYKVTAFILTIVFTIIFTRLTVLIKDLDFAIKGYQLHHFHYGVILLIITVIFMLFGKKHENTYRTLAGIAMGLIIDEFLFILATMNSLDQYFTTFPSVVWFTVVIIAIIEIINLYGKREKRKLS